MSRQSRIAGLILAAIVFVLNLADPRPIGLPVLDTGMPVVLATVWAVSAFVSVWFLEGVLIALRWFWRRLLSG